MECPWLRSAFLLGHGPHVLRPGASASHIDLNRQVNLYAKRNTYLFIYIYTYKDLKLFVYRTRLSHTHTACDAEAKAPSPHRAGCAWPSTLASSPWRTAGSRRTNIKRPAPSHAPCPANTHHHARQEVRQLRTWRRSMQRVAKKSSILLNSG